MVEAKAETDKGGGEHVGVFDPGRKVYVDTTDVDGLIGLYERADAQYKKALDVRRQCAHALEVLTEGDARTRRVRGETREAQVVQPDDYWDQSMLFEAWNSYPKFRDEMLKIATLRVRLRIFKKAVNTSGPPDFEQFRNMVAAANKGPSGTPRIVIEK